MCWHDTVFSGLQVAPEYKLHPLFLPKIWEKFIDKLHMSISRTLFCYFLARRNVLGCIHVMRRSAKERQDAIDVVQKTLHAGLIVWAKVCGDAVIWCQAKTSGVCPTKWVNCVTCVGQSPACIWGPELRAQHGTSGGRFPRSAGACSRRPRPPIHRQRETLRAGEGWLHSCRDSQWLWSTVLLWVSWSWSSADRGTP